MTGFCGDRIFSAPPCFSCHALGGRKSRNRVPYIIYSTILNYRYIESNNLSTPLMAEGYYAFWWFGAFLISVLYWVGISRVVVLSRRNPNSFIFLLRCVLAGLTLITLRGSLMPVASMIVGAAFSAAAPGWPAAASRECGNEIATKSAQSEVGSWQIRPHSDLDRCTPDGGLFLSVALRGTSQEGEPAERYLSFAGNCSENRSQVSTMHHVYVQYGCGYSACEGWLNFDASPTLRIERIPLFGNIISAAFSGNRDRFPASVRYGDIRKGPLVPEGSADGVSPLMC